MAGSLLLVCGRVMLLFDKPPKVVKLYAQSVTSGSLYQAVPTLSSVAVPWLGQEQTLLKLLTLPLVLNKWHCKVIALDLSKVMHVLILCIETLEHLFNIFTL